MAFVFARSRRRCQGMYANFKVQHRTQFCHSRYIKTKTKRTLWYIVGKFETSYRDQRVLHKGLVTIWREMPEHIAAWIPGVTPLATGVKGDERLRLTAATAGLKLLNRQQRQKPLLPLKRFAFICTRKLSLHKLWNRGDNLKNALFFLELIF